MNADADRRIAEKHAHYSHWEGVRYPAWAMENVLAAIAEARAEERELAVARIAELEEKVRYHNEQRVRWREDYDRLGRALSAEEKTKC